MPPTDGATVDRALIDMEAGPKPGHRERLFDMRLVNNTSPTLCAGKCWEVLRVNFGSVADDAQSLTPFFARPYYDPCRDASRLPPCHA